LTHSIAASVDYRLGNGAGPTILGSKLLQNAGFNVTATAGSGFPYTRLQPNPLIITNSFTADVLGGVNEARLPWTNSINLRSDKGFQVGGATLVGFLWIENLLDTRNVLGVYRVTGLPDNDGFIDSPTGVDQTNTTATVAGDPLAGESYVFNYSRFSNAPINVGGFHTSALGNRATAVEGGTMYGPPRTIRLGLRLHF